MGTVRLSLTGIYRRCPYSSYRCERKTSSGVRNPEQNRTICLEYNQDTCRHIYIYDSRRETTKIRKAYYQLTKPLCNNRKIPVIAFSVLLMKKFITISFLLCFSFAKAQPPQIVWQNCYSTLNKTVMCGIICDAATGYLDRKSVV